MVLPGSIAADGDVLPKVLVARAVAVVLALIWIARMLVSEHPRVRRTRLDLPIVAIVPSALLSTLLSVNPTLSLLGAYTRYEGLLTIATYAALFWLGAQFVESPRQARMLLRALLAGAAIECLLACSQVLAASVHGNLDVFGESSTTYAGVARAFGTMANANNLAIWLAMLLPVALYELITARSLRGRFLAGIVAFLMAVTLLITFGRAAWIGAAFGLLLTLGVHTPRQHLRRTVVTSVAAVFVGAGLLAAAGAVAARVGVSFSGPVADRVASLADPASGSGTVRLHFYADTLRVVADRPLVGYGPDTFGIVFPSHTTGDWTPGIVVDKAHSDILQVAATQGVLGAAASAWLIVALVRMLAPKRRAAGVAGVAGAVLAYEIGVQLNFAWFPVTAPFWTLLVAAVALSGASRVAQLRWEPGRALRGSAAGLTALAAAAVLVVVCVRPALADHHYATSLADASAGDRRGALRDIAAARSNDGAEAEYAAFQGDLEDDLAGDHPGPEAHLLAARRAYEAALTDGEMYPRVAIRLAYVDLALGDAPAALDAARAARRLDPYGPAEKLVAELGG